MASYQPKYEPIMLDKLTLGIMTAIITAIFKKKTFTLWGIRYGEKTWTKIWDAPKNLLITMQPALFAKGFRTLVLESGIQPPPIEIDGQVVY